MGLVLQYAFEELQLTTVRSACLERNPASGRVLKKNGFVEAEGFVYTSTKFKDERAQRFELSRGEWLKRRGIEG